MLDADGEEPTTYEAALMAKHVYGDNVKLIGGWHVSSNQYKSFNNARNGLKSALYERTRGGVTEYTYATAGTQDFKDVKEDVMQIIGNSSQYEESVNNARKLNSQLSNSELTFVGHSLGGGLAAANALATDRNAITFNPAALTNETKTSLHLPATTTNGQIHNIVVHGEFVNHIQSKLGLKPEGSSYILKALYLPGNNLINTILRINNHSINTVINKIKEEQK
jgi:predicted esterase